MPREQEGTERLAGRSVELDRDRIGGQSFQPVLPRDLAGQHRAHGPVEIPDRQFERHLFAAIDCRFALLDELPVQNFGDAVILFLDAIARNIRTDFGILSKGVRSRPLAFQ